MILAVAVDLVLVLRVAIVRDALLRMPSGPNYVTKAVAPLLVYGLVFSGLAARRRLHRGAALQLGSGFGIVGGLLLTVHMGLENFGDRIGENSKVTLAFMLGTFLIWGVAGFRATQATGQWTDGAVAACWSAMVSVLTAVTFGLALLATNIPPPAYVATWPEFKQSGWTDARAFGAANCLDAVLSHLVVGPAAGVLLGSLGAGIARLSSRSASTAT